MRVNIAYSVGLEEIPKEVANLLPKGLLQNDTMFQIIDNLENENVDSAITSIDNLRKDLFETDQRLADCMAILQGYLNTKYSQPPDPNSVQDELSNIQEQLESLGVELENDSAS
jgi:hypothetical protein